jgi:hypothetical protein
VRGRDLFDHPVLTRSGALFGVPSGYRDTFAHALWINVSDLALACAAYFVAVRSTEAHSDPGK